MNIDALNPLGQQNIQPQNRQGSVNNLNSNPLLRIKSDAYSINNFFDIHGNIKDFAHFGDTYDNKAQDARMEKVCQVRDSLQKLTDKYSNFNFNLIASLPEPNPSDFPEGKVGFDQYKEALKEWSKNCNAKFKEIGNMLKHIDRNNNCVITIGSNNNVLVHINNNEIQDDKVSDKETKSKMFLSQDHSKFGDKGEISLKTTYAKLQESLISYRNFIKSYPNMKFDFESTFPLPNIENFDDGEDGFKSYMKALNDWSKNCNNHFNRLNKIAKHIEPAYECVVTIGDNNNLLIEIPSNNHDNSPLAANIQGNDNNIALVSDTTQELESQSYSKKLDENKNNTVTAEVSDLQEIFVGDINNLKAKDKVLIASNYNFNNSVNPEDLGNSSSLVVGNLEINASEVYIGGEGNGSTDKDGNAIVPNSANNPAIIAANLDINANTTVVNEASVTGNDTEAIQIDGENNNVALVLNHTQNNVSNSGTFVGELTMNNHKNVVIVSNNNFRGSPIPNNNSQNVTNDPSQPESRQYEIKEGDLWVKIVKDQYGITEGPELDALVGHIKNEYFEANKLELTKQGYDSSKSGFLPKAGTILELPQEIEINENKYRLV